MFKDLKNTIAAVPEIISEQGERFLKTVDEIEGELSYYTYLQDTGSSPAFLIYQKLRLENRSFATVIEESSFLEENY